MKYRIVRQYGIYYPQKRYSGLKWFLGWVKVHVITDGDSIFKTTDYQKAKKAIEQDYYRFLNGKKDRDIFTIKTDELE